MTKQHSLITEAILYRLEQALKASRELTSRTLDNASDVIEQIVKSNDPEIAKQLRRIADQIEGDNEQRQSDAAQFAAELRDAATLEAEVQHHLAHGLTTGQNIDAFVLAKMIMDFRAGNEYLSSVTPDRFRAAVELLAPERATELRRIIEQTEAAHRYDSTH